MINRTDILSRTVSELSQLIVQILDTSFLSPPLRGGGGLGTTYAVHLGLIGKRVVDSLLVLIELLSLGLWLRRYERISVQNRRFRSNGGASLSKISGRRGRLHQPFFFSEN